MSDLIRREDAMNAIKQYCRDCDNYNGMRCKACNFEDAMCEVYCVPPIDAVEVVRCADCKYYESYPPAMRYHNKIGVCFKHHNRPDPVCNDGFCNRGVRKEKKDD